MKFRTLLTDPNGTGDRPKQAFHPDTGAAREWAATLLAVSSPQAYVTLYIELEVEAHVWKQSAPGVSVAPKAGTV
jgi:hypothetical protein